MPARAYSNPVKKNRWSPVIVGERSAVTGERSRATKAESKKSGCKASTSRNSRSKCPSQNA